MAKQALIVIDIQNDYFPEGKYPLHQPEAVMEKNRTAMALAAQKQIPIIHVQHLLAPEFGEGLFFYEGTSGAEIHKDIMAAAPDAPVIEKRFADCFEQTNLEALLQELGIEEIVLTGMMTHNCVIHTALSPAAAKYSPKVIEECTTSIDPITHALAVNAMQVRGIEMPTLDKAFD